MQDERIIGDRDGAVGHIIFNNPAKLNAVSLDMWEGVHALLSDTQRTRHSRGGDERRRWQGIRVRRRHLEVRERTRQHGGAEEVRGDLRPVLRPAVQFPEADHRKIMGYCIGGGMNFAGCCDLRFCNETARFGVPAGKLGLGYGSSASAA